MGDIGEGASMHQGQVVFQRLDQVGLDGLLEQHGHGSMGIQVAGPDGFPGMAVADGDVAQPLLELLQ